MSAALLSGPGSPGQEREDRAPRWTVGRLITLAAVTVMVVLGGLGVLGYTQINALLAERAVARQSQAVLGATGTLQALVLNAETGQRGFVLTGDVAYLTPYDEAVEQIPVALDALAALVAGDPRQRVVLADAATAITAKLAELSETVRLRREEGFDAAQRVVRTDRGRQDMVRIENDLTRMRTVEWDALQAQEAQSRATASRTRAVLLAGSVAGLLFILVAAVFIWWAITAPLNRVTAAARRVTAGDLSRPAEISWLAEVAQMARAVNASIAALLSARDAAVTANATKSAFLATMSHEIRTPLNAVIGMSQLLDETPLDEKQREFATTIHDSGEVLLALINDILDFSKIEAGDLELESRPFDLRECLESAAGQVAYAADQKGLELVIDLAPDCPPLLTGDVGRLRQILVNLLNNAVKFTVSGEVVLTVSCRPGPLAGSVRLSAAVRDTGIGIPADRLDRLFKSFSQVDASTTRVYGGTGLGLVISRHLAQAMDGDITVTSTIGAGSTFLVTVTLLDASPTATVPDPPGLTGRALLVDDNDSARRVLARRLREWGMSCEDVGQPGEAVDLVELGNSFDVALVDLRMPGTDGRRLVRSLRRAPAGAGLPVILLSGAQERPEPGDETLFQAVLTKPVRGAPLLARLHELLSQTGSPGPDTGPPDGPEPAGTPLAILLAEDNEVNQRVATLLLARLGHAVDVVGNGRLAVEAVTDHHYDVVLMDVQMPEMDGLMAARTIRHTLPPDRQPYIVAMTASTLDEDRRASRDAGMDAHLGKPARLPEIRATLEQARRHLDTARRASHP